MKVDFFPRYSSPLPPLLLLAISIGFSSTLPRLEAVQSDRPQNERRAVLRRKVVVNKSELRDKIDRMSNKTRIPEIGATLKEEEIALADNKEPILDAEKTTTATGPEVTNTTSDTSSSFTSLFLGFPRIPTLSELPLGIGWVFDSLLPTVRHTQMPPHILL